MFFKEISFDVDVSKFPCGLNAAIYFVNIDWIGNKSNENKLFGMSCKEASFMITKARAT